MSHDWRIGYLREVYAKAAGGMIDILDADGHLLARGGPLVFQPFDPAAGEVRVVPFQISVTMEGTADTWRLLRPDGVEAGMWPTDVRRQDDPKPGGLRISSLRLRPRDHIELTSFAITPPQI